MELHLDTGLQAKLRQWSAETGRPAADLVADALAAHLAELAALRSTLDARYDEVASGVVQPIPGDEARRFLDQRLEARGRSIA